MLSGTLFCFYSETTRLEMAQQTLSKDNRELKKENVTTSMNMSLHNNFICATFVDSF